MTTIVDGKAIANQILRGLKEKIRSGPRPSLGVVLVGRNPASVAYVTAKRKRAEEIGIAVKIFDFPDILSEADLAEGVKRIATNENLDGIIVQLPLPKEIKRGVILELIPPELDVDCLTAANKRKIADARADFLPPTAAAILRILEYYGVELTDKRILLVGQGDLVGRPLAAILSARGLKFDTVDLLRGDLSALAPRADVIVSATGQPGLIRGDMVKPGAVVIDAGTAGTNRGVVGDVDTKSLAAKASLVAAVPGGVGPVTIAMLLKNVVASFDKRTASQ